MSKISRVIFVFLILLVGLVGRSMIAEADGNEEDIHGITEIGIVKTVLGDVVIDHEVINYEVYGGEVIKKEVRKLENNEFIYSNTIITTGRNSQVEFELLDSYNREKVIGSIVLKENSELKVFVSSFSSYVLETGKMNVYLNGKKGEKFIFDNMEVVVEMGQEVEFEMQGSKGGN